jgi:transposase
MERLIYPSDMSDAEWQVIRRRLPLAKPGGRPRKWPLRVIVDAIFYIVRGGGCAGYLFSSVTRSAPSRFADRF